MRTAGVRGGIRAQLHPGMPPQPQQFPPSMEGREEPGAAQPTAPPTASHEGMCPGGTSVCPRGGMEGVTQAAAALLVAAIHAVSIGVAAPAHRDAVPVLALELVELAAWRAVFLREGRGTGEDEAGHPVPPHPTPHLPHSPSRTSSEPSAQSWSPSHFQRPAMQRPLAQENSLSEQGRGAAGTEHRGGAVRGGAQPGGAGEDSRVAEARGGGQQARPGVGGAWLIFPPDGPTARRGPDRPSTPQQTPQPLWPCHGAATLRERGVTTQPWGSLVGRVGSCTVSQVGHPWQGAKEEAQDGRGHRS